MFVSIAHVLARALERDWVALVKEMKTLANDYLKDDENTALMNDPQEVRALWSKLDRVLSNPFGRVRLPTS